MKIEDGNEGRPHSLSRLLTALWPGIPFMGMGVWLAWQLLILSGGSWISDEGSSVPLAIMNLWLYLIAALVLLIAPLLKDLFSRILDSKYLMLCVGLLGALGAIVTILGGPYYLNIRWAAPLSLACCGVTTAFLALKCGQIYGTLTPPKILIYALLSELLAVAIFFMVLGSNFFTIIPGGPTFISSLAMLCLPLLAVWAFSMAGDLPVTERSSQMTRREQAKSHEQNGNHEQNGYHTQNGNLEQVGNHEQTDDNEGSSERNGERNGEHNGVPSDNHGQKGRLGGLPAFFWKLIIAVFIISLAANSIRSFFITPQSPATAQVDANAVAFLLVIFALAVLLLAIRFLRYVNFNRIYLIVAMLIAAVLFITPLLPVQGVLLSAVAGFAVSVLDFTVWCLLALIVSERRLSSITVFGVGRGIALVGSGLGWALGMNVIPQWQGTIAETLFCVFLALLVIIAAIFLFTEKDYDKIFSSIAEKKLNIKDYVSLSNRESNTKSDQDRPWIAACLRVGTRVQLTEREQQVMEQISLGRSQKFIAKRMTISHNTVRTHTGNLYAKLDIHSREELIELIESEFENNAPLQLE